MSIRVASCVVRGAEQGPSDGAPLLEVDRRTVGPATRVAADVLRSLGQSLDSIVVVTTVGDPTVGSDPHGLLRRAIHRAFDPRAGTTVVSAGDRSVAAGLIEASLRLQAGVERVGLIAVDWVPAAEVAVGFVLTSSGGVAVSRPTLTRGTSLSSDGGRDERSPMVGALRLAAAIRAAESEASIVLDRVARDGIAWAVTVTPPEG